MKIRAFVLILVACSASASLAAVSSGGEFELRRTTIDSGGGQSQGGGFVLQGTIGQPDAGQAMQGGNFSLRGGFWTPSQPGQRPDPIFLDGFE